MTATVQSATGNGLASTLGDVHGPHLPFARIKGLNTYRPKYKVTACSADALEMFSPFRP